MAEAWEDPEYKSLVADIQFAYGGELAGIKERLGEQKAESEHEATEQKLGEPGRFQAIDAAANRAGILTSGFETRNTNRQQSQYAEQASNRQNRLERQEANAKKAEERAGSGLAMKLTGGQEMAKQRYANWVRENPPPEPAPTPVAPAPLPGGVVAYPYGGGPSPNVRVTGAPGVWKGNVRIGNPNVNRGVGRKG